MLEELVRRGIRIPPTPYDQITPYLHDPVPFVRHVLGGDPWEVQQQIMRSVADFPRTAVRSCHHSGKTWTAAAILHWFLRAFCPSLVITTAPTDRQVRKQLWGEIGALHRRAGLGGRLLTMELQLTPEQRAFGFTTNEPEKFQGWHCPNILFIVDEASGVGSPIYEAIEGCLTSHNARLLLIGNPNSAEGYFYEAFQSPLYQKFHISADDVPEHLLPPSWAEERRQEWGEESPVYQVRVKGNFPDQGDDSLIRMSWITAAQEREMEPAGHCEIGVDVARQGSDESVLYVRQSGAVVDADHWRGHDTMQTAGRVRAKALEMKDSGHRVTVRVDEIGVGYGVLDRLTEAFDEDDQVTVVGVNVGESAIDSEHFANLRSEIFWGLRERFRTGDISIPKDDTLLLSQLVALKFSYTPRGQVKLESKDDLKKRRGASSSWQSPDRADALALCYANAERVYELKAL